MGNVEDFTILLENNVSGDPIYVGKAPRGSDPASAVWQIKRITYDGTGGVVAVEWAEGKNDFNKVWNDRATYAYS